MGKAGVNLLAFFFGGPEVPALVTGARPNGDSEADDKNLQNEDPRTLPTGNKPRC